MTRDEAARAPLTSDRIYAAFAVLAAVLGLAQGDLTGPLLACVALALVPWALVAAGRALPLGWFAVLSVLPVAPLPLLLGNTGALFLTTAAASRLASRSDDPRLVGATTAAVVALPFLAFPLGHGDRGAVYFAFGNVFGVLAGGLLRRATRLAAELRIADAHLAEAASREERQRLARDVHDLVAHSLTVVVLHVGGARRVLRSDPAAAECALADAERVCRESLDGIRGVVGLLREDSPTARSLDLHELVATYREAGLAVDLHALPLPGDLPLLVRVTLHHVVQEALANAARHAGPGAPVSVTLTVESGAVVVRVANPAPPSPSADSGGYGLVGLAERVTALGGELHSGPDGDCWVVRCRLPHSAGQAAAVPVQAPA